jgi:hypothetical protein
MNMVRHDCEAVQMKLVLVSIAEEGLQEKIGVGWLLKVAMLEECRDGNGIGVALLGSHGRKHTSGLKP